MKIISVVGARPQFIKAAIVSKKLRGEGLQEILVHTGQHYDFNMSDIFFKELDLPKPDYYLGIGSGTHSEQTGKMLMELEKVYIREKPDLVIVYGDTNSTLAGALAASKLHIPVAHVEAGLRSFNKRMPEEINRVLTDHISDLLFTPTEIAVKNLYREGITKGVYNVGDVMYDIALESIKSVDEDQVLTRYGLCRKDFILATIHRAENTDNYRNLVNIWEALNELARKGYRIFFPVHPRTRNALERFGLINQRVRNLIIAEPVSYFEMLVLEKNAKVIITDSGGVQKEGYFWGTPCIIPRNETEWVELVDIGFNVLVGANKDNILEAVNSIMNRNSCKDVPRDLYGYGNASEKIVNIIRGMCG